MSASTALVREGLLDLLRSKDPEVVKLLREALPQNDVDEPLIDAREAGKLLGLSAPAVRAAAWRGTIPCTRVGRTLRFRRSDLLKRR